MDAIAVIGDVHGHLQLALCVAARWQEELGCRLQAVLLCGDVGTFTHPQDLDNATRSHARQNPCELEFLHQWSRRPQPAWIEAIFRDKRVGGLGLTCPVIMVHGNHEGFPHLARIGMLASLFPEEPVPVAELPTVDAGGHIRYLPSGWRTVLENGRTIAGVGGITNHRQAKYHPLAYIDAMAVEFLAEAPPSDIIISHQGPAMVQGEHGAPVLDLLIERERARLWFHGHSTPVSAATSVGPQQATLVTPLADIAFDPKSPQGDHPGSGGWAMIYDEVDDLVPVHEDPPFLREFRRHKWLPTGDGQLIAPSLRQVGWKALRDMKRQPRVEPIDLADQPEDKVVAGDDQPPTEAEANPKDSGTFRISTWDHIPLPLTDLQ